jgi:uncharacterized protein YegJ (DUF2314 family)
MTSFDQLLCKAALLGTLTLCISPALAQKDPGKTASAASSAAASASSSAKSQAEIVHINESDPAMQEAFKKAQTTFDDFLKTVKLSPKIVHVASLKLAVHDGMTTDYVWLLPFEQTADGFKGTVNSLAVKIAKIQVNDELHFKRADVVDWMYIGADDKRMHGNFTTCVLLRHAPAQDVSEMKVRYGLDCSKPLDH